MEPEVQAALIKVCVFVLVQALVYLILSQSSTVFSRTRSLGGRGPARSPSLGARRMIELLLSDLPLAAGEPRSPVAAAFARTWSASSSPVLTAAAAHRKQD